MLRHLTDKGHPSARVMLRQRDAVLRSEAGKMSPMHVRDGLLASPHGGAHTSRVTAGKTQQMLLQAAAQVHIYTHMDKQMVTQTVTHT